MRVTVLLSEQEGKVFEAYCEQHGYKKSTLISRLIREHIEQVGFGMQSPLFGSASRARVQNEEKK